MILWDQVVEALRVAILAAAHMSGGSLGAGIVIISAVFRVAMFPLALRLAKAAARHQRAMRRLQPEIERIKKRHKQPQRVAEETRKLLAEHGLVPVPVAGCVGALAQAPVFVALYTVVRRVAGAGGRFLWIGDIARPDALLALLVTAITYGSVALAAGSAPSDQRMLALVPVLVTLVVLWSSSAGVALHWGVSATASLFQAHVVRRSLRSVRA